MKKVSDKRLKELELDSAESDIPRVRRLTAGEVNSVVRELQQLRGQWVSVTSKERTAKEFRLAWSHKPTPIPADTTGLWYSEECVDRMLEDYCAEIVSSWKLSRECSGRLRNILSKIIASFWSVYEVRERFQHNECTDLICRAEVEINVNRELPTEESQ